MVEVFEAEPRAGGRVETIVQHGYCVDTGATTFAARYPVATQLAEELSLRIVDTAPYLGVYRDGRFRLLRLDRLIRSGLRTDLLTLSTKLSLRGMLSYEDLRAAAPLDTETARDYVRRLAGAEADAYFGGPITRALLLADSGKVSRVELMSGLVNAVAGRLSTLAGGQGTTSSAAKSLQPIAFPPSRIWTAGSASRGGSVKARFATATCNRCSGTIMYENS